jgi:hypothetical protein
MNGDIQFNNPHESNKSTSKKALVIVIILFIFIITAVGVYYLLVNSKSNNFSQGAVKISENKPLQANNQDEKIAEKIKQMEAQRRPNPPKGFLSIDTSKLPSDCSLEFATFTEKSATYHYECKSSSPEPYNFPYYLNYWENSGKFLDEEVKQETESKVQNLKVVKDFLFQNSKGVIVGTFTEADTSLKNPIEYRLYWMHGDNLIMIHTTNVLEFAQEKLIELLKSLK